MSPYVKQKGEKFTIPGKYLLFLLTLICCALMVVSYTTDVFNNAFRFAAGYVVVPYQKGISSIGYYLSQRKDELVNIKDLLAENAKLREEISALESENNKLLQDKYELNTLRELYELKNTYDSYTMVGANVIYCDSGNWFSSFILDKGYNDGICPDMNVIYENGLVGRITVVGPNWSKVTSIISDNFNVSGQVLSTSDNLIVTGSLEDIENGVIPFSQLMDPESCVTPGDKIVTSEISDKYLPGILVGYITEISQDTNNLTKSGYLVPAVNFEHIDRVLIIMDLKQQISKADEENGYDSLDIINGYDPVKNPKGDE